MKAALQGFDLLTVSMFVPMLAVVHDKIAACFDVRLKVCVFDFLFYLCSPMDRVAANTATSMPFTRSCRSSAQTFVASTNYSMRCCQVRGDTGGFAKGDFTDN